MRGRAVALFVLALQAAAVAACDDGPASPSGTVSLTMPAGVTGTIMTCATCTTGPTVWAVATANVSIVNASSRDRQVASVEARAVNSTRGGLISSNTRPNADFSYPQTSVGAGATLTLEAAVVYFPLPPPADNVRFVVVVTFTDGSSVSGETQLITGA